MCSFCHYERSAVIPKNKAITNEIAALRLRSVRNDGVGGAMTAWGRVILNAFSTVILNEVKNLKRQIKLNKCVFSSKKCYPNIAFLFLACYNVIET